MDNVVPRPHAPWCDRQNVGHSTCHLLVKAIDVTAGLRIVVELHRSSGTPTLVSMSIDRAGRRNLVPLSVPSAGEVGAALTVAAQTAREG